MVGWLGINGTFSTNRLYCAIKIKVCWKCLDNWMAPWKNRISSTSMKLRKSLVKSVMRQNISSCLVLSPEIIMHDAFNVILWTSADICIVMHDNLGWKNRTTRYILTRHWLYQRFLSATNVRRCMRQAWRSRVNEQHVVIGFGELVAVD